MIYDIHDRPKPSQLLIFAVQQLLASMAATIAVLAIVGNGMTASAAIAMALILSIIVNVVLHAKKKTNDDKEVNE